MTRRLIFATLLVLLGATVAFVVRHGVTVTGSCAYLCMNGK